MSLADVSKRIEHNELAGFAERRQLLRCHKRLDLRKPGSRGLLGRLADHGRPPVLALGNLCALPARNASRGDPWNVAAELDHVTEG